ncbi:dTDP-glucose 4,6-dehydratase [Planktomarina temperata]|nr:dTDP-glucose 4,6-dehydratase [Planktomarina temperata]
MKILVTGGSGFIGSSVVRLAVSHGHTVINLDALTYAASEENVSSVMDNSKYFFEKGDIRDRYFLDEVLSKYEPDAVMNLAAETHVDRSISGPAQFIDTNISGTFNLLEAVNNYWRVRNKPEAFVFHHVSTDEVFGSLSLSSREKFKESTPYQPRSPYSASKASSDHLVRAWHETYGLPVVITNCSNNYGPYQFPEKLIPFMILRALAGETLPIYGDGRHIRDWLFVEDHAKALLLVLENGVPGSSYNIGGETERSNLEIVQYICTILDRQCPRKRGSYTQLLTFVADRPGHDVRYAIDSGRIKKELGWRPTTSFNEGLELTVEWYLKNYKHYKRMLDRV